MVELNALFSILYQWMVVYECSHIFNFHDFLIFISFLVRCFFCILPIYLSAPVFFLLKFI